MYIEIDKLFICNKHNKRWLNEERQSFTEVAELRRLSYFEVLGFESSEQQTKSTWRP